MNRTRDGTAPAAPSRASLEKGGIKLLAPESRSCRPSKRLPSCKIHEIGLIRCMYLRSCLHTTLWYLSALTRPV
jgi:hypothetical protein